MQKINRAITTVVSSFLLFGLLSCNSGPQPIRLGQDACSFCKMSIADTRFGAEILTKKGKAYKFDDMHCLLGFMKSNTVDQKDISEIFLVNFDEPHNFIPAEKASLLKNNELHSPMGGDIAAFEDEVKMNQAMKNIKGESTVTTWNDLLKAN